MYILGISCFYHDSSVALLKDGKLVFAAEEERFVRRKHYSEFPTNAVNAALDYEGLSINDIDYVAFYEKPFRKFERILRTAVHSFPRGFMMFMRAMPSWLRRKLWVPTVLQKEMGYNGEIAFIGHHLAHAGSAFLVSPFEEAAILTLDGVGEDSTTAMGVGRGNDIEITHEINFPHSLGLLYSMVTAWLGFRVNSGEGKVMGLASYGKPRFKKEFADIVHVAADGSFQLNMDYFAYTHKMSMIGPKFFKVFGPQRKSDEAMSELSLDVAATLQDVLEEIEVKMARALKERTGAEYLCIAGGVGLNSLANWRIMREVPYKDIFVQPASGERWHIAGRGVLPVEHHHGQRTQIRHGPTPTPATTSPTTRSANSSTRSVCTTPNCPRTNSSPGPPKRWRRARSRAGIRDVWSSGRGRCATARSLPTPTLPDMKDVLNARVKHREPFRPFAPVVTVEDQAKVFRHAHPFAVYAAHRRRPQGQTRHGARDYARRRNGARADDDT